VTDVAIVLLIVAYAALGYWTGAIRRVVGLAALYLGFLAATASAPTAANVVLQVYPGWTVSDALMLGYFLVIAIILVLVEVLGGLYHAHIQLAAVLADRASGAVLGALTAVVGLSLGFMLLVGASQPVQGSPDGAQIQIHDAITKSAFGPTLVGPIGRIARPVFAPVIPADSASYFNGQAARLQH
jgi:uncharacterized membrane protein required for colicin V production